jgi:hypothetical protein
MRCRDQGHASRSTETPQQIIWEAQRAALGKAKRYLAVKKAA